MAEQEISEQELRAYFLKARKAWHPKSKMICPDCGNDSVCETAGRYECGSNNHRATKSKLSSSGYTFSLSSKTLLAGVKKFSIYYKAARLIVKNRFKHIHPAEIMRYCGVSKKEAAGHIRDTIYRIMQPQQEKIADGAVYYIDNIPIKSGMLNDAMISKPAIIYMALQLEPTGYHTTATGKELPSGYRKKRVLLAYYEEEENHDFFLQTYFTPKRGRFVVVDARFAYSRYGSRISDTGFYWKSFISPPSSLTNHRRYMEDEIKSEKKKILNLLKESTHEDLGIFLVEYMFYRNLVLSGDDRPIFNICKELIKPISLRRPLKPLEELGRGC